MRNFQRGITSPHSFLRKSQNKFRAQLEEFKIKRNKIFKKNEQRMKHSNNSMDVIIRQSKER